MTEQPPYPESTAVTARNEKSAELLITVGNNNSSIYHIDGNSG